MNIKRNTTNTIVGASAAAIAVAGLLASSTGSRRPIRWAPAALATQHRTRSAPVR